MNGATELKRSAAAKRPTFRELLTQCLAPDPTDDSSGHEQDDSDDGQPNQSLDHKTQDREDQPNDKKYSY